MGIFNTLYKKQVHNGIFIALLLVFAIGIFAWWYLQANGKQASAYTAVHPLSNTDRLALCRLLPPVTGGTTCLDAEPQVTVAGHSMWKDVNGKPVLRADLITTRNLLDTEKVSTTSWFQRYLPEIQASGRQDWEEPKGAWTQAVITRRDAEQEILLEDSGVILILQSNVMARADLLAYANATVRALRNASPAISSVDAATPQ
ncbi:MAG: hypothetical protein ACREO1_02280 [Arenimonas sp.]